MTPPVNSPAIKVVKSVREQVSPEEWQTRVDLAACYRLTAMYGMTEMIANHISCRVPGSHDHFLINPYGMLYEEIDASCLIKIDVDGNVLFNASDYGVNAAGFVIHSAIHMAQARRRLRGAYPYAGRHGGIGDGMRTAAAGADLDAVPPHRLP